MEILLFFVFLLACAGAGATGAVFPPGKWYETLDKPPWTPPNWVFPVMWTSIYLLISFAGARVAVMDDNALAMAFWAAQAALATLWTPVFFGLRRLYGALLVIAPLWVCVAAATLFHFSLDTLAGLAFVPYLVWVTIASALNLSVARRNPNVEPYRPGQA